MATTAPVPVATQVPLMLQASSTYQYQPLGSKASSYRLLKLLKSEGMMLECELSLQSRDDGHIPYEALSYTWGSSELVERITVNGKQFWITDNLYAALQCLRRSDRDRFLWIDAVCINQADKEEQGHQVQQMGEIYRHAEKVLFWLGKPTSDMMSLAEALIHHHTGKEMPKDHRWEKHRNGLQQMLNREWFARVWILQEVANAQTADVCSGAWSIPAETFVLAPSLVQLEGEIPLHCKPVLEIMANSTRSGSWWAQKPDLRTLLRRFQASKATDERDKIYALLGLSSDQLDMESVTIDYQRPIDQVLNETIPHLLRSTSAIRSGLFAYHEVLNLMASFTTVNTTCFIFESYEARTTEILYPHLQTGEVISNAYALEYRSQRILVSADPALLLFEKRTESALQSQKTCYDQVMSVLDRTKKLGNEKYEKDLQVYSWGSIEQHVKVVVIRDRRNAIYRAANLGCDLVVEQLLKYFVFGDEEKKEWKGSLLAEALEENYTRTAELILNLIGPVDPQDEYYSNALVRAASSRRNLAVVKKLLDAGVSVNTRSDYYNGNNALQMASSWANESTVKLLLDARADVNAQGGEYGNALQAAASDGDEATIRLLLDAGADVNAQGGKYGNALQVAAYSRHTATIRLLLDAGANVNAQGGRYGNALQAAARRGNADVVKLLLDAGADPNIPGKDPHTQNTSGVSALQMASKWDDEVGIKLLLLDAGAHPLE
ncbi:uncharacterized protein N0V89_003395 [Didymosphaeria variabile]|uniref:Heterokaryon incompatibility domain-containing protein n=1 Tax=Didymosphaeria variabile TaxID=1932322 RepID=A0A9W8XNA5_9PLEO|nr:uncharacterized protein N0V89_003395 [Didymosphaeria variabile]KAJ4355379.1 hypothetical protein N0V89_003395 [Didymosphaeria variabile]